MFDRKQPDLFSAPERRSIPIAQLHRPGQKTSREALEKTVESRDNRQRRVFNRLTTYADGTIPEILAAAMGEELIDVRRCFSVFKKLDLIEATGEEIKNEKGNFCAVWKAKTNKENRP